MFIENIVGKSFECEICGGFAKNVCVSGVETVGYFEKAIELCTNCGPIDSEVMQVCRESASACSVN